MAGEKSLQSAFPPIAHQGGGERGEKEKKQKTRGRTKPAVPPALLRHPLLLGRPGRGPAGSWSRAPGRLPRSVPWTLRAPRPPSSGRLFLAPAAAALPASLPPPQGSPRGCSMLRGASVWAADRPGPAAGRGRAPGRRPRSRGARSGCIICLKKLSIKTKFIENKEHINLKCDESVYLHTDL